MANINPTNSKPSLVNVPFDFPMEPSPGKINILFDANKSNLYHKFNARNYDNGNVLFGSNQPYIYRYPDEPISDLRQIGGQGLPLGLGVDDLTRMSKFIGSGRGLIFVAKQFLLQGFQPFDETNIYNPTEVILSATSNLTGGILGSPKRHVDKSGGLLGALASLVGVGISRGDPPPSTVAGGSGNNRESEVLPVQNYGNGAGLLRAKTANKARSILQSKWGPSSGGSTGGILSFVTGLAKSMFPQLSGTEKQDYKQRADDVTYEWMVNYYNNITSEGLSRGTKTSGLSISFMGIGLNRIKTNNSLVQTSKKNLELFKQKYYSDVNGETKLYNIDGAFRKNEDDAKSEIQQKFDDYGYGEGIQELENQKDTYFNTKNWKIEDGRSVIEESYKKFKKNGEVVTSKELTDQSKFVNTYDEKNNPVWFTGFKNDKANALNTRPPSENTKINKIIDSDSPAAQINDSLQRVIKNIGNSQIYTVEHSNVDTWLLSSGKPTKQGYDRLFDMSSTPYNMKNNPNSVESEYYNNNVASLDSIINPNKNFGFSGNSRADKINTLVVLDKNRKIKEQLVSRYTEWKPYEDDLIAFFFYDVVNEKYIPFRATVKGISESNNALWDELRFMGRSDALYSYTGFTRNLSFSFTVVVNSLIELYPVWQRVNYIASSGKPANYTKKVQNGNVTNRFAIAPMFMLTIGDLYKYQPVVLTSVSINIPENASWETQAENSTEDWSYLSKIVKSSVNKKRIGQLPREIEVSVACNVLEKERPIVGGNHFGHAPGSDNDSGYNQPTNVEHLPAPQGMSKNIRAFNPVDRFE